MDSEHLEIESQLTSEGRSKKRLLPYSFRLINLRFCSLIKNHSERTVKLLIGVLKAREL